MTTEELIEYVKVGIDRNILVFDSEAKDGVLSGRLIELMKDIALYNGIILKNIIIPMENTIDKFYKEVSKGSFPYNKVRIIIGIGPLYGCKLADLGKDSRHVLLGCY